MTIVIIHLVILKYNQVDIAINERQQSLSSTLAQWYTNEIGSYFLIVWNFQEVLLSP